MPERIGKIIGNVTLPTTSVAKGIWSLTQQLFFKKRSEWPFIPTTATGGTILTPGDGYKYHVFTGSADFTVTSGTFMVDAFIVAGGGGGGAGRDGGGGGAGGLRTISSIPVVPSPGVYPMVVGGAGSGMPTWTGFSLGNPHPNGSRGGDSTAFSYTSTGGGSLPGFPNTGTGPGGSGSGGDWGEGNGSGNTPPVSPPQGNNGGTGVAAGPDENQFTPGGGGGAGGVGTTGGGASRQPGPGGVGATAPGFTIPGSYGTPGPTPSRFFSGGGGGGGGGFPSAPTAPGGYGGGGTGQGGPSGGSAGTTNTGGGGGGGGFRDNANNSGGNGGSGIVIVRYTPV